MIVVDDVEVEGCEDINRDVGIDVDRIDNVGRVWAVGRVCNVVVDHRRIEDGVDRGGPTTYATANVDAEGSIDGGGFVKVTMFLDGNRFVD